MIYVSEYEVDRAYGGPEEGGWWYDTLSHQRIMAIVSTEDDGHTICQLLNAKAREEKDSPDRYSMACSESDLCYYTEDKPGELETTERPHYE